MERHQFTPEDRNEKLQERIDAHIHAVENAILVGCKPIVTAVANKTGEQQGERSLNCGQDEAEALVRAAVLGGSALVGLRIAEVVSHAIYVYALPLAEADLVDAEKNRAEQSLVARAERWLVDRGVLA